MSETETMPPQKQELPGSEQKMHPKPISDDPQYKGTGQLKDKVALIMGEIVESVKRSPFLCRRQVLYFCFAFLNPVVEI